jgi:hypothetical protein
VDRAPTRVPGVLAVFPSDPEVTVVYPEMSSTILPHSQEIRLRRGDDLDIKITVQNDGDPPDPINLGICVLRWAVKQGYGDVPTSLKNRIILGNEAALILKRSSYPEEIEISSGIGRAVIHVRSEDTSDLPLVPALWDMELIRAGTEIIFSPPPESSSIVQEGMGTIICDQAFPTVRPGDIITVDGTPIVILKQLSPHIILVDRTEWTTISFPSSLMRFYRGTRKTVAGGSFVILGDVVR